MDVVKKLYRKFNYFCAFFLIFYHVMFREFIGVYLSEIKKRPRDISNLEIKNKWDSRGFYVPGLRRCLTIFIITLSISAKAIASEK